MLEQLLTEFPIPREWSTPEVFREETVISGVRIHLLGLSSEKHGLSVSGSAAGFHETSCIQRAYFELIERIATAEAETSGKVVYRDDPERRWRYARSNGIAIHTSVHEAVDRSYLEVVERDRVMRSWFGDETRPVRLERQRADLTGHPAEGLLRDYSVSEVWFIDDHWFDPVHVVCCFGKPRSADQVPFFGYGCARQRVAARDKALDEAVQRLGFTWGEPIGEPDAAVAPTAIGHLDYYLHPTRAEALYEWWNTDTRASCCLKSDVRAECFPTWQDITPDALLGKLYVMKCEIAAAMPLVFGMRYPFLNREAPREYAVHPIA